MTGRCACPTGPGVTITDPARHDAWHLLVIEQHGPAEQVNTQTLRAARGMVSFVASDDLLTDDRNVLSGKRRSSPQRLAEAKLRDAYRRGVTS